LHLLALDTIGLNAHTDCGRAYTQEELMNRPVTDIGRPDVDTMAVLMVEIQRRPPGRVGMPFSTSFTWQRKSGEGCRIQCQHQNLWPGPPVP